MKVHCLLHASFETPGYIEHWLNEKHYTVSFTKFFEKQHFLPDVSDIDAVVIMGGPMSVYDEATFPWLQEEKTWIKDCMKAGKKILGICLGAQLIADCLDAKVIKADHREIGWFPLIPTEDCRRVSWFYELVRDQPTVFHWHGDRFQIPDGALDLLTTEANSHQAFYCNKNIIGLQFHAEVTLKNLQMMMENGMADLKEGRFVQSTNQMWAGSGHIQECNKIMKGILMGWITG